MAPPSKPPRQTAQPSERSSAGGTQDDHDHHDRDDVKIQVVPVPMLKAAPGLRV